MKKNVNFNLSVDHLKERFNNILIIEDDECYRDLIKLYASNISKNVEAVCSKEKAAKLLESKEYDLVITDYFIPNREFGSSIIKDLEVLNQNTPVILMSGDLGNIKENDYNLDKIQYFLEKPVLPEDFYKLIENNF